ncbi:hypothetical protein [Salinigranum marinum]|uniref:hypothetical protein n=1 Tax=Salinigranum marinum TaxID=1515595 RepID=UPI002989F8B3|nr:hypothetical protein [Salinigranum marinum]
MSVSDAIAWVRQPEYTGENRCLPCTVVNVLVAAVAAALLSVVLTPLVGLVGFAVGVGLVYLRGYLVPGTPQLTETYFPPWLLRLFGKEPIEAVDTGVGGTGSAATTPRARDRTTSATPGAATPSGSGGETEGTTGVETHTQSEAVDDPLVGAGVVDADGATPTPAFGAAWLDRAADVEAEGVDPADVAAVFGADEAREAGAESFVLDGSKSVRWGSHAALVADVAAAALLAERLPVWETYDRDRRQSVLIGLRLGLDRCPLCDGDVSHTRERVDPCCQKPHLVADAVCSSCGAALADAAVVDDGETDTVRERLLVG